MRFAALAVVSLSDGALTGAEVLVILGLVLLSVGTGLAWIAPFVDGEVSE
jgi:hypothetical protein